MDVINNNERRNSNCECQQTQIHLQQWFPNRGPLLTSRWRTIATKVFGHAYFFFTVSVFINFSVTLYATQYYNWTVCENCLLTDIETGLFSFEYSPITISHTVGISWLLFYVHNSRFWWLLKIPKCPDKLA